MEAPMIAALILVVAMQAPKASMLGKEKPWWEKIKPGDVVQVYAIPGTAVIMVPMWRQPDVGQKYVWDDIYWQMFVESTKGHRWTELHEMLDREKLRCEFIADSNRDMTIIAIEDDKAFGGPVAEVISGRWSKNKPLPDLSWLIHSYRIPVACLGKPGEQRHPQLDGMPVMVRRFADLSDVACHNEHCCHMDAIPYAEAERAWKEKQARMERLKRRAEEESRRREADRRR